MRPLFLVFGAMGATASLVPAVLPVLAQQLHQPVITAAPILFGGLLVGVLLSPLVARLVGIGGAVRTGALAQFVGLAMLAGAVSSWMVLVAAGIAGVGFGLVEASATTLARDLGGDGVARLLAMLTGTVAIVATVAPLLVVLAGTTWFRFPLALAAVAQLVAAIAVPRDRAERIRSPHQPVRLPIALIALALFLYVGIETTLSGLSAVTLQSSLQTSATFAAVGTSAFWLLMTVGRFVGAAVLARGTSAVALASVALVVVTVALAMAALAPGVMLVFLALAVLGCGPCYGLLIATAGRWMTAAATSTTAALIAVGAIGGTVLPAIVIAAGGLVGSAWIPAAAAAVAVLLLVLARTGGARA